MSEWQPIETAPAGTRFLACCVDPEDWRAGDPDPYDCIEIISGPFKRSEGHEEYKWLNHGSGNYTRLPFTHWQPLPPPPDTGERV